MIIADFLEINVVSHCNLSCKGCSHLSPILSKENVSILELQKTLGILGKYYNCRQLRLLGGEPLLHPKINEVLEIARDSKIAKTLRIISNGLLLHQMDEDFWKRVDEIELSLYPGKNPSDENIEKFKVNAERFGVKLILQPYHRFFQVLATRGTQNHDLVERIFATCEMRQCHTVAEGHFFKCPPAYLFPEPMRGCKFDDGIKVEDSDTFRMSLIDYLSAKNPLKACHFCAGSVGKPFPHEQTPRRFWLRHQENKSEDVVDFNALKILSVFNEHPQKAQAWRERMRSELTRP